MPYTQSDLCKKEDAPVRFQEKIKVFFMELLIGVTCILTDPPNKSFPVQIKIEVQLYKITI